jgi:hypothetical protein
LIILEATKVPPLRKQCDSLVKIKKHRFGDHNDRYVNISNLFISIQKYYLDFWSTVYVMRFFCVTYLIINLK